MAEGLHLTNDRYVLRREIGAGGMGVVYEALDRERDALVALKTLQQMTPVAMARLKREFRSLADVIHPNLVALYELVAEVDQLFFTMELIDGTHFHRWVRPTAPGVADPRAQRGLANSSETTGTLDTHALPLVDGRSATGKSVAAAGVKPIGELDLRRLRLGLRQLAEAIQAIHDAGVLHRDLKPSNVLVTESGRLVVLDFGLATDLAAELGAAAEERPLEGTATYMSPEQGARSSLTPASDWYALGVMLYEALTGRPPFLGGREDMLMDKQRFEPPAPSELAAEVPRDLELLAVELLRRDPERRPLGVDVLRRLGSDAVNTRSWSTSTQSSHAGPDVLIGRDTQLAQLDDAYRSSRAGAPVVVEVHGPSGMGKSRLVRAFLDEIAEREDALVLRGRCYERESVPFKALDSLIDAFASYLAKLPQLEAEGLMPRDALYLARVFPVLRQVEAVTASRRRSIEAPDPQELRSRAFGALRELLARVSDRMPIVCAIDDLQWGDVDSASLLASLLQPPDPPALLLLASYRIEDVEGSEFLRAFHEHTERRRPDVRRIEVGPLSEDQARKLALLHLRDSDASPQHANRIAQESAGSPFFVEELARHVRDDGGAPATLTLTEVLRSRLLRLPTPAAQLLSTIAVAAGPVPQKIAMRAADIDDPAALSLLKAGSFVRTRSAHGEHFVEAYHDRVRETAAALLSPDELQGVHRRLAITYEATPRPDPEMLAIHLQGAGDTERAAEFAALAAERAAQSLAFDRAAHLYRMAIELGGARRELLMALGEALSNAGRGADAAEAFLAAIDGAPASLALELRKRAAENLLQSGHLERGLDELQEVLAAVSMRLPASPRRALMSFLLKRAQIAVRGLKYKLEPEEEIPASQLMKVDVAFAVAEGLGLADIMHAADFQARHLLIALKVGEPKRVARALAAEAVFQSIPGIKMRARCDRVLALLDGALEHVDDMHVRGLSEGARGVAAFQFGDWKQTIEHCQRAETTFRNHCTAYNWELTTAHIFMSFAYALRGEVHKMMRQFPAFVKEANDRGDLHGATNLCAALGFYLPLAHDDPDTAYREVEDAMARWPSKSFQLPHSNALNSMMFIDLYAGEGKRAFDRAEEKWRTLERSMLLRAQVVRSLLYGVRGRSAIAAAAQTGDTSYLRVAERIAGKLSREGVRHAECQATGMYAGIALMRGDQEEAVRLLDRAAREAEEADLHVIAQTCFRLRGTLLGGDEGAALVAAADGFLRAQGFSRPERWMGIFIQPVR